jgi:hypothetical protein
MLKEIVNSSNITIKYNNQEIIVPDIKEELCSIVDNCYLAPCMAMANDSALETARLTGLWIELIFEELQTYKEFEFEKLLINLFPKHDFLVLHRFLDGKYQGKSITINLSYKTTSLYKYIKKLAEGLNNEN